MNWLADLLTGDTPAHTLLVLCLVSLIGLAIGSVHVKGIGLGIAGVLFAGLGFGHFGITINHQVLEFLREFGLILFVYSVGTQVGPSFLASLKKEGLPLNLMAAAIIGLGVLTTIAVMRIGNIPPAVAAGLFSGATTNTPSLAAAQQALQDTPGLGAEVAKLPGLGYAVAYPFGIMGIILTMLLIKSVFRVRVADEVSAIDAQQKSTTPPIESRSLEVRNPEFNGVSVVDVPTLASSNVVVSRIMRGNHVAVAEPQSTLNQGDVVVGVGTSEELERLQQLLGGPSDVDVRALPSEINARRIIVTQDSVMGKTLDEVGVLSRPGVVVTRVRRMELEFTPSPNFKLQFGDSLLVVGDPVNVGKLAAALGDSPSKLDYPRIIPLFFGIALGVLIGSIPIPVPGMPVGVKLGLAGGPLIVSLLLSRVRRIGPMVFYMPKSANIMMREFGIVLFLACAGLKSGDTFIATLTQGDGFMWLGYAALITLLPLLIVGFAARAVWKLSYPSLCGLLSGSMTDPPALAFAGALNNSETPSLSYATVYPLTMLLRVISAQLIVLLFAGGG
jgi:putative transport protein